MKILYRNFTRLLSIGTFESDQTIENMSEFKWNKLLHIAGICNVKDLVCNGIVKCNNKQIPQNIYKTAENNIYNQLESKDITPNYNFASGQQIKAFSCFYLNRRLNRLIFNEIHSIDTSIESLIFLKKLINNINNILNQGINIRTLADLGKYLREYGDKIDFIKIENWIKILNIKNMCTLIGCILVQLFSFETDELPFITTSKRKYEKKANDILENNIILIQQPELRHEVNENEGHSINPISKPNTSPLRFFKYFPSETISRFIANIIKSLSNIDE